MSSLINVACCIFIAASFYSMWSARSLFSGATGCGDATTNALFTSYGDEMLALLWMDVIMFSSSIIGIIGILVSLFQMIVYPNEKRNRIKELAKNPTEIELLNPKKDSSLEPEDRFMALAPNGFASSFDYGKVDPTSQPSGRKSVDTIASAYEEQGSFENRRSTGSFARLQPF